MSSTIRVSEKTHDRLVALAQSTGQSITKLMEEAVDALERRSFFDRFNRRYEAVRDDPEAWTEIESGTSS